MTRIYLIICVFWGLYSSSLNSLYAQESVSDFLLTAFEDQSLAVFDAQTKFIHPRNFRIPIIDEIEIRIGNDERTYEDLQYALRVRPSNPWKIRRNNAFFNATKKELSIRKQVEIKENLIFRYELLTDYFYERELYNLSQSQQSIVEKKALILQQNMESNLFDARDFADAKLDQIEGIESLDETLQQWNRTNNEISIIFGTSNFNWDLFDLIAVSTIDSLSSIIANSSLTSIELELIAQRIEVARQEVRVEKADFDIGFIQAEYLPFTDREVGLGYSVGFTIPIFNKNRSKIAERKLDEIELKNELTNEQYRDSVKRVLELEYLKNLINHHYLIESEVEKVNLKGLTNNLARIEDYDPISFLDLKVGILKLDELILKSKRRVFEQYVKFLETFDVFTTNPLTNYLSDTLEKIE